MKGKTRIEQGCPAIYCGVARLGLDRTVSNISKPEHSKLILPDEIVVVPIRELSYNDAKKEISDYIEKVGDRKVYISELAEELVIDFELIEEIMEELEIAIYALEP